jgi:hypothetical protein
MAKPQISRTASATVVVVVATLALLWAIWWLWLQLSPRLDIRTIVAIAIVALVLLAAAWWLWWRLPQRQVARIADQIPAPKDRADVEDNFRKTVGQALGGAAVLIGAVAAYLQFTQQQQASHELLISNQVSKSFEQLGSKEIATRLGGIYGLEGVMQTSPEYYQPVLEALCAFVRESTRNKTDEDPPVSDIQAALTVIGRRSTGTGFVNLVEAHFPKSALRYANLAGADLTRVDLRRADLRHAILVYADLDGAQLNGADLRDANLSNANLSLVDLSSALLNRADLRFARELRQDQLDAACGTDAKLPKGLTLKPCQY